MMAKKDFSVVRLVAVGLAIDDEHVRFNKAIQDGKKVLLKTFSGEYTVKFVDTEFWYHTDGNGGFGQSWAGCNDATWANLLEQAGVKRHPLFCKQVRVRRAPNAVKDGKQ